MTDSIRPLHGPDQYRVDVDEGGAIAPHVKIINRFPTPLAGGYAPPINFTATASAAVSLAEGLYHFKATADCHVQVAANPTATTSDTMIFGDEGRTGWHIPAGMKISVVRSSADGTFHYMRVTES